MGRRGVDVRVESLWRGGVIEPRRPQEWRLSRNMPCLSGSLPAPWCFYRLPAEDLGSTLVPELLRGEATIKIKHVCLYRVGYMSLMGFCKSIIEAFKALHKRFLYTSTYYINIQTYDTSK